MKKEDWIDIKYIEDFKPEGNILIWQKNLADPESSRFQRAIHFFKSHITVYPLTHSTDFIFKEGKYIGYDLEGDMCEVTHFALVENPFD